MLDELLYGALVRPWLFRGKAQKGHGRALKLLGILGGSPRFAARVSERVTVTDERLQQTLMGLSFPGPIGMGAGFARSGHTLLGLQALGFSSVEVGTITPDPELVKEPYPEITRLPKDRAIIHRPLGGPNPGAVATAESLVAIHDRLSIPIGINLGKGEDIADRSAVVGCETALERLHDCGDYFAVNIYSPKTHGLKAFEDLAHWELILSRLIDRLSGSSSDMGRKPLLVKLPPDLMFSALDQLIDLCVNLGVDGVIATNGAAKHTGLKMLHEDTYGLLSGKPLYETSYKTVLHIRQRLKEKGVKDFTIIGSGGISDGQTAYQMLKAGADLLQIYTGFIYGGPFLIRAINQEILQRMQRDGFSTISEICPWR